jgi:hypothetical protein
VGRGQHEQSYVLRVLPWVRDATVGLRGSLSILLLRETVLQPTTVTALRSTLSVRHGEQTANVVNVTTELLRAPDYAEPIVAWRTWLVAVAPSSSTRIQTRSRTLQLTSVSRPTPWIANEEQVAVCVYGTHKGTHRSPLDTCSCGIYASKKPQASFTVCGTPLDSHHVVLGLVALWGRVIEHAHGFRAERAYPYGLVLSFGPGEDTPSPDRDFLRMLASEYGVPVMRSRTGASVVGTRPGTETGTEMEASRGLH